MQGGELKKNISSMVSGKIEHHSGESQFTFPQRRVYRKQAASVTTIRQTVTLILYTEALFNL
jgi:hypothetical protein